MAQLHYNYLVISLSDSLVLGIYKNKSEAELVASLHAEPCEVKYQVLWVH